MSELHHFNISKTYLCVEAVKYRSIPRKSPPQDSFWHGFVKLFQCHWDGFNNNSSPYQKYICVFKLSDEEYNLWSLIGYTRSFLAQSFVALDNLMKAKDILVNKYRDNEYFRSSRTFTTLFIMNHICLNTIHLSCLNLLLTRPILIDTSYLRVFTICSFIYKQSSS